MQLDLQQTFLYFFRLFSLFFKSFFFDLARHSSTSSHDQNLWKFKPNFASDHITTILLLSPRPQYWNFEWKTGIFTKDKRYFFFSTSFRHQYIYFLDSSKSFLSSLSILMTISLYFDLSKWTQTYNKVNLRRTHHPPENIFGLK